jgi:hypothetical protein
MDAHDLRRLLAEHMPNADDGIATHALEAVATTKLPLSYALALLEKESGGQNVYGHDGVRNPAPKGGRVTQANYAKYKRDRKAGLGMQGVGPTQLTWYEFQDHADRIGGCWRPYPNMVVGFALLGSHIKRLGKEKGAAAFNGTGPDAERYGRDWVRLQEHWHRLVA